MASKKPSRTKNLGLAALVALTGFVSLMIIFIALFLGLWLDNQMGQRGLATICLLALSVPINLYVMVRIALGLTKRMQLPPLTTYQSIPMSSDEKEA